MSSAAKHLSLTVRDAESFDTQFANAQIENDILIGFACGHVYHLSCIISTLDDDVAIATAKRLQAQLSVTEDEQGDTRSVGAKVAHAHMIKAIVAKGCLHCGLIVE